MASIESSEALREEGTRDRESTAFSRRVEFEERGLRVLAGTVSMTPTLYPWDIGFFGCTASFGLTSDFPTQGGEQAG
jgi:hypothetical protein